MARIPRKAILVVPVEPLKYEHGDGSPQANPELMRQLSERTPCRGNDHRHEPLPEHRDRRRIEEEPSQAYSQKRQRREPEFAAVPPVAAAEQKRQEQKSMQRAPENKRPVRAVPKPRYNKDDKGIANLLPPRAPAAAKRYIELVPEPCRERHVQATPKLADVAGEIRKGEILPEIDSKQPAAAYGYV